MERFGSTHASSSDPAQNQDVRWRPRVEGAQLRTFSVAGPERTVALDAHGQEGMTPGAVPGFKVLLGSVCGVSTWII